MRGIRRCSTLALLLVAVGMSDLVPDLTESSVLLVFGRIDDIPISTLSMTVDAFLSGDFGSRVSVRVFRASQVPRAAATSRMSKTQFAKPNRTEIRIERMIRHSQAQR